MTIGQKAIEYNAINLSQGFPDFDFHPKIKDYIVESMKGNCHQYAPPLGLLPLRENLATLIKNRYKTAFNPKDEILICAGATQGIFITIMALVAPNDRVLLLAPFYDSYAASVHLAKGVPVEFHLTLDEHASIDFQQLEDCFKKHSPKVIIFNNPHNPSGKCFSIDEMKNLLMLAHRYNCFVISDEVYEFLVFDKQIHTPLHTLNNTDKLITISSAGKTFGYTGHKLGWILANPSIIAAILKVHQYNVFSVNTPMQWAYAKALAWNEFEPYVADFVNLYEEKRDFLYDQLKLHGWDVLRPQGTYFMLVKIPQGENNAMEYALRLLEVNRLATIPVHPFYLNAKDNPGHRWIRLCFAKKQETLDFFPHFDESHKS